MHLTNGATWIRLNFTQLIFNWLISWEGFILSGSTLLYGKKKHKPINAEVKYCLFPDSVVKQVKIFPSSWRMRAGWKKNCCFVCHVCVQRRYSNLMGRLGSSLGNCTWSPHMLLTAEPLSVELLLTPNTLRPKEKKCDLDVNHSELPSWVDCGEPINASYCWGLVCVMFANTNLQLEQIRKNPQVLYFSHAGRRLSSKSNCALTCWCSAHSFSCLWCF